MPAFALTSSSQGATLRGDEGSFPGETEPVSRLQLERRTASATTSNAGTLCFKASRTLGHAGRCIFGLGRSPNPLTGLPWILNVVKPPRYWDRSALKDEPSPNSSA